ncbi:MAG: response regulator [Rhodoferax sp.]|uniref:response regulator n=1 Tax=Rhodoferax sp. TaxID=50421 RepID=UPI0030163ED9
MSQNYFTTQKAATLLGVSLRTAQQWLEKGYLEGWKTAGGHRRITHQSVTRVMRERAQGVPLAQKPDALPLLIIEDDLSLLKLYRRHIAQWSFKVTVYTTTNGFEGLVMVGEMSPRLLICDLRLPGANGFQVVRSLCEMSRFKKMTIVVVTGLPLAEINAHGGLPESVEILAKPIDFERLQAIAHGVWSMQSAQTKITP